MAVKRKKKKEYVYLCGKKLTIPEFRAEIHKREKGEFIPLEQFIKEVDEWYEKNIK
ncbi:MAG: hypothetical protein J6W37_09995 [Bacteroidales bacterium]|jgi:hypothetical protein|nr:hypothetical protein [Bacteroidales bacterium]